MPVSTHTTATRTGQGVGQVQARGHRAAGTDCKYKFKNFKQLYLVFLIQPPPYVTIFYPYFLNASQLYYLENKPLVIPLPPSPPSL